MTKKMVVCPSQSFVLCCKKDKDNVNMLFIIQKDHMIYLSETKCNINRNFMQSLLFFCLVH